MEVNRTEYVADIYIGNNFIGKVWYHKVELEWAGDCWKWKFEYINNYSLIIYEENGLRIIPRGEWK